MRLKNYEISKYSPYFKIVILILGFFLSACSTTRYITQTKRSVIEQLLLTKSIDKAVAKIDSLKIQGSKVYIEIVSLAPAEENYLRKAVSLWFLQNKAVVVETKDKADYIASIVVKSVGTDTIDTNYLGIPSLPVPLVGILTPEVEILASKHQKGYTEMQIALCDASTGEFIYKTKPLIGQTHFSTYKIFLIPIRQNDIF